MMTCRGCSGRVVFAPALTLRAITSLVPLLEVKDGLSAEFPALERFEELVGRASKE